MTDDNVVWLFTSVTEELNSTLRKQRLKRDLRISSSALQLRGHAASHAMKLRILSLSYLSWPAVSQICNLIFFPPEIENIIKHDLEYEQREDPLFEAPLRARVEHVLNMLGAWAIVVSNYLSPSSP